MKRKTAALFCAGVMVCTLLAGCGKKETPVETGAEQEQQTQETVEEANPGSGAGR